MIEKLLANCLRPVLDAEIQLRRRRVFILALCLGSLGFLVLVALAEWTGWWSWTAVFALFGALAVGGLIGLIRASREPDWRELASRIEERHPDLNAALLTALDQKTDEEGNLGFLQQRLLSEVSGHAVQNRWVRQVSEKRLRLAGWGQFASVVGFFVAAWFLLGYAPGAGRFLPVDPVAGEQKPETPETPKIELSVTPGDVELEKGSRLVVEGAFSGRAPASARLIIRNESGERTIPMTVGLDDTVFSALIPKVDASGAYAIQYEDRSSEEFEIAVFELPRLEQANVVVTPPALLDEEPKTIEDTRKITVMEGSRLEWQLRVNKPITMAELFGEDETSIPLEPSVEDEMVLVATHVPTESQRYRVHLVDDADRANRRPPWITVTLKRNNPPNMKLTFPGRDFEVSAVQELPLEAEVFDEVGVEKVGYAYQFGDEEVSVPLEEEPLAGGKKHVVRGALDLEPLGAEPRDLVTYYFWAEDRDNSGNLRRTTSDMFFAEVRYFEEIVREGSPQQGGQPGQQGESGKLLELQKEVINAAWKLLRYHDLGREFDRLAPDIEVVHESQLVVLSMIEPVIEKAEDPELKQIFEEARDLMEESGAKFAAVLEEKDGDLIAPAHQAARAVFAKLIEAQSREQQISMSKSSNPSGSQQEQQRNMNLELEQKDLKYEENSMAQSPQQTEEQRENLAVLNRLKELARRQEAIAEKIKELEDQLQDAGGEERAEIERQLKRLEEEQRELLREVDDLSERMDSESNRANMSEQREELDETRENIQRTAEELSEGQLADAATSATRASRELEEIEDEFRERTSRQFAEEMRSMRDSARQLSEAQEEIEERLEELTGSDSGDPFTSESQNQRGELAQEISEQSRQLSDLVEEMKQLSEEAESSEPILSDALYDAVRDTMTGGTQESLEEARDMTFYNRPERALTSQQAAARGIENLREAVEAAAEKVLGNEADALRMARSELDQLIEESREEARRLAASGEKPEESAEPGQAPGEPNGETTPGGVSPSEESPGEASPGEASPGEASPGEASPGEGEGQDGEAVAGMSQSQPAPEDAEPGEGSAPGTEGEEVAQSESPGSGESPSPNGENPEGQGPRPGSTPGEKGSGEPGEVASESGGRQPGTGRTPSEEDSPGEGASEGAPSNQASSGNPGAGRPGAPSETPGRGEGESESPEAGPTVADGNGGRRGGLSLGGDNRGSGAPTAGPVDGQPLFFNRQSEQRNRGPITGEDYTEFRDRLGNIEEMLPQEDLRNDVARVADDARAMRIDYSRDNLPPGAAAIEQRITEPLVELRQRVSEEIAKLNRENPIAPVDRDPVPSEFRDLVRRYYEQLGSGD